MKITKSELKEIIQKIIKEELDLLEQEKWSKDIKIKKGEMHRLLGVSEDETIISKYSSGKKLAQDLLNAVNGNKKKATGMLAYAANLDPQTNVLDAALKALKDL